MAILWTRDATLLQRNIVTKRPEATAGWLAGRMRLSQRKSGIPGFRLKLEVGYSRLPAL
jgi:hypothetical protein